MTHLGDRVSAYVDGQLPISLTERVTAHLATCPACREAVERERSVKTALTGMFEPAPGAEFMISLMALGGPAGPLAPRDGHMPGAPRPPLVMFEADVRRTPELALAPSAFAGRGRRLWGGALIAGATVVGAGVLSATFLPLTGPSGAPSVRPASGHLVIAPAASPASQGPGRRTGGSRTAPTVIPVVGVYSGFRPSEIVFPTLLSSFSGAVPRPAR